MEQASARHHGTAASDQRAALQRAIDTVARLAADEAVSPHTSHNHCSVCREACVISNARSATARLVRFYCTRKSGSVGRGRGSSNGKNVCGWRLCFLCANGLDADTVVCCAVCQLKAQEHEPDSDDEEGSSEESSGGEEEEDPAGDVLQTVPDAQEEGSSEEGSGGEDGDGHVGSVSNVTAAVAADDMFAMALPTAMPSMPDAAMPPIAPRLSAKKRKATGEQESLDTKEAGAAQEDPQFRARSVDCRDCGHPFVFSASEQRRLADLGFQAVQTRCADCKQYKKNRFSARGGRSGRS